jgi:O-acetyl-ADP-ribose deacetylase
MDECRKIERCPTGEARITRGGNLQARHVIHAVGPIYNNGKSGEAQLLSSAYRSSLQLAQDYHLSSVAFPSLSTGAYRYPVRDAAKIALQTVVTFLTCEEHQIELVRFVLFDEKTLRIFEEELKALINE